MSTCVCWWEFVLSADLYAVFCCSTLLWIHKNTLIHPSYSPGGIPLPLGEKRGTPWIGCQSITGPVQRHRDTCCTVYQHNKDPHLPFSMRFKENRNFHNIFSASNGASCTLPSLVLPASYGSTSLTESFVPLCAYVNSNSGKSQTKHLLWSCC